MNDILRGEDVAKRVLGASQGAYAKHLFKIDTASYSWIDDFLRDAALRRKIDGIREKIKEARGSLIDKGELRIMLESSLSAINSNHLSWFVESLKSVQQRTGPMVNSDIVRGKTSYTPRVDLSKSDIDNIFTQLPEGVTQAAIDAEIDKLQKEIIGIETIINNELSPPERWIYRDDGKRIPYPQGCRWTQFVDAWKIIVRRYDGPVNINGSPIDDDREMIAYKALGLDNLQKVGTASLRKPGF